jgi:hypothetical protein
VVKVFGSGAFLRVIAYMLPKLIGFTFLVESIRLQQRLAVRMSERLHIFVENVGRV